ncbi:MAG TPA: excinuclease ABC subunit UvrA, partial [Gaiellales bacterium]|nr:excinuclease ABC subunit UvrA [Gaiellales bacterium]
MTANPLLNDEIVIHGAREHNLRNVTVRLPRGRFVCITGLSGSGKSSLAFDTLYAEGQRRYVESLSAYARQFLGQMDKPDVDSIEGLSPAISIDQKTTSRNPRSTVGTVTEVHDYLRLLFARIGRPHCPICGRPIAGQSAEQIVDQVLALPDGTRFTIDAPLVRGRKGEHRDVLESLRGEGFTRVRVDGETYLLDEVPALDKKFKHDVSAVVDRLVIKDDLRPRLTDSIETALRIGDGLVEVREVDGPVHTYSEKFACPEHGVSLAELAPRTFSFNSPHGACPACTGLGATLEVDPELVVPDPVLSIREGALAPWNVAGSSFFEQVLEAIADRWEVPLDRPWGELSREHQDLYLNGTGSERVYVTYKNRYGRKRSYMTAFEGVVANLQRRYRETQSQLQKERIETFMSMRPCSACGGARLRPEALAVTVGGHNIDYISRRAVHEALAYFRELELTDTERLIAERVIREIRERLTFLDDVGVGYLSLDRAARTLSGGEAQRIRLATQIGASLVGVLYILDEPSIGLHQRDNARLIATLERLRDIGNTVIVVEHDEETMRAADWVVDMGPGAGIHGGRVVAEGTAEDVAATPGSLTGQYLSHRRAIPVPARRHGETTWLKVSGVTANNLQEIDVEIPIARFVSVTGVSGSGKSTLVNDVLFKAVANRLHRARQRPGAHRAIHGLEQLDKIIQVDQSPIGRTPRSNPATYTGLFDVIRDLFSKTQEARA